MFDSNLVISYMRWKLKILQAISRLLSLQMKKNARKFWGLMKSIDKPLKKKLQHLPLFADDLRDRDNQVQTIQYENVALQAQKMYISPSYKDAKTPSFTLEHVM